MTKRETHRVKDLDTLKALGHPLRMKLYRALYVARAATASHLAESVDEAVSLVSYHLRKLHELGLVEEAEPQGTDGRERWWQLTSDGISIRHEDVRDAPELLAAQGSLIRTFFAQRSDLYLRHLDEAETWGAEWRSASMDSEWLPRLTAAELSALQGELGDVVKKYQDKGRAADEAGDTEGREQVAIHAYAFPFRP
ncbi:ArsR/SmtB family transcription factor [Streptomyces sp. NBC_01465]|uniref:ArsR/SmtB family transcription factor n=1 Tax=Streptomyces sp. NBC_01465 TaxID=2903878 RepID=UPI002E32C731|nr:helix-turn-helix domain-containing protein [Streptomyces sp. NBC_01465]